MPGLELRLEGGDETVISWDPVADGVTYDVIRGRLQLLQKPDGGNCSPFEGCCVDLGAVLCLVADTTATDTAASPDTATPPSGDAFFYLVRYADSGQPFAYGGSSLGWQRQAGNGDCPP